MQPLHRSGLETYLGGQRSNITSKRAEQTGRGPASMTAVVGMKDRESNQVRAEMVEHTDAETLQQFIVARIKRDFGNDEVSRHVSIQKTGGFILVRAN